MSLNFRNEPQIFGLTVDDTTKAHMLETRRWTKFTGILFSILIALASLMMLFVVPFAAMQNGGTAMAGQIVAVVVMILIVLGVNFYPIYALLRFSSLIGRAIEGGDQAQFNQALRYMKNMFKYIGIASIILILFYGVAIAGIIMTRQAYSA